MREDWDLLDQDLAIPRRSAGMVWVDRDKVQC